VRNPHTAHPRGADRSPPMPTSPPPDPTRSPAAGLGAALRRLRALEGLTQAGLGHRIGYDRSYIASVERGAMRPSREMVERCDQALQGDGELLLRWARAGPGARPPATGTAGPPPRPAAPGGRAGPGAAVLAPVEVARRAETSGLGPGTLAAAERTVARLRAPAPGTPARRVMPVVVAPLR